MNKWIINIGLFLGTLVIMVILSEIMLGTILPQKETITYLTDFPEYRFDPAIGNTQHPNQIFRRKSSEFDNIIHINSEGFYDTEWDEQKNDTTFRIVALGDSYTYASAVPEEIRFSNVLESSLSEEYQKEVEVLNFGLGGYGQCEEYQILKHKALQYDPDVAILFLYIGNDFTDTSNNASYRPYCDFLPNGTITVRTPQKISDAPKKPLEVRLIIHSHLGSLFMNTFRYSSVSYTIAQLMGVDRHYGTMDLYDTAHRDRIATLINRSARVIHETQNLAQTHNIPFFVVIIPHRIQVVPEMFNDIVNKYNLRTNDYNLTQPNDMLATFLDSKNITYVDLSMELRHAANRSGKNPYFRHEGHLNEFGHEITAHVVSDFLRSEILTNQNRDSTVII